MPEHDLLLPIVQKSQIKEIAKWNCPPRLYLYDGECEVLLALVDSIKPRVMIEVGCNEGLTARAMLQNIASLERYIGIDVQRGYVAQMPVQQDDKYSCSHAHRRAGSLVDGDGRFELLVRRRGSLDIVPDDLPRCQVMFIDGDHGDIAVRHDTALAEHLVEPGGMIIWHDYHQYDVVHVSRILHELQDQGRKLLHVENTWIAYERR